MKFITTITFSAFILPFLFEICTAQTLSQKDYNKILNKTNNHTIIGLGEAEHFYKGYYNTKVEVVKYLINNESIDIIALEASVNATALLNNYINGNITIDLPQALTALNEPYALQEAGLYNCSEIVEFIEWLKDYNHSHNKTIKLVGIDFQNYSLPLEKLKVYSSKHQIEKIDQTKALLDSSMRSVIDSNIMIITSQPWIKRLQLAQNYIKNLKDEIYNGANQRLFSELEQFTTLWDNPMFPRDSIMYENLTPYIDGKSRVLIWAANFHLEKDPFFKGPKKLGVFLNEKYGEKYCVIGVSDQIHEYSKNLIHPPMDQLSDKYEMIINVPKGDKCVIIN
ncbi:erythromycin esterase family protein [Sphingobacterium chungjuense]|uniref:erythromycin esterase family protein n=1 Tax=Sphingobacterium chungjuense TaxID=2675553 RepID=UPI001408F89A|nr:erythromycin esterase family protein [Sphingobacterium chungjuense]